MKVDICIPWLISTLHNLSLRLFILMELLDAGRKKHFWRHFSVFKTSKVTKNKMPCYFVLLLPWLKTQRSLDAAAGLGSTIAIKGSLRS